MSITPSNHKGTRDFLPEELSKRNYIIDLIKKKFISFGFSEIKTPSIEKNKTLSGKYGDDGDKLTFKILNSGVKIKKADLDAHKKNDLKKFVESISEKGLRYDLTVPLARFISQHQNKITLPFKRFQIQNVWRADRPQFGRFQEFTQCDADILGKSSIIQEIELLQLYDSTFSELGFDNLVFKINHRSVLYSIANYLGIKENYNLFFSIIDKIEKNDEEKTITQLKNNFQNILFSEFVNLFEKKDLKVEQLKTITETYNQESGFDEIITILNFFKHNNLKNRIEFDLKLARGLNYYTGLIVEVVSESSDIGSLGGGGRYDDLTSQFNLKNVSGIGISFGLDRIYLEMDRNSMFPDEILKSPDLLVVNFGLEFLTKLYPNIQSLRDDGTKVDIYPNNTKLNKQLSYANKLKIHYVIIFGENEFNNDKIIVKDMFSNSQKEYRFDDFSSKLFNTN